MFLLFRDEERGSRVSVAVTNKHGEWMTRDLTDESVGMWEPSLDQELWRRNGQVHLFVQRVGQGDGEKLEDLPAQMVSILEWRPQ